VLEFASCGTLGVDADLVDLSLDGNLCKELMLGWSKLSMTWRGGGSCSSGRLGRSTRRGGSFRVLEAPGPLGTVRELERGEPPILISSPHSHVRRVLAAMIKSLLPRGEATAWMTPTCSCTPPRHWAHHRSTSTQATGLCWRKRLAPPPSAARCGCHSDHAWQSLASCAVSCTHPAVSPRRPCSG
jgi:hypothetical protein